MKPSTDPKADKLINSNISQPKDEQAESSSDNLINIEKEDLNQNG